MESVFEYINTAPVYVLVAVIVAAGVALYYKYKNGEGDK
jgi:hypothetical protein